MLAPLVQVGSIFFVILLVSCGPSSPTLEGIDLTKWRQDVNGCGGERAVGRKQLVLQKDKLLGLAELDVVALLGKPDRSELSTRNQKFYYYFLEPASVCGGQAGDDEPSRLAIRFNAMGLAKEIRIEEDYLSNTR
jgi:hypothetical protein